ncbi:ATP-grasp domain-containing protein [Mongoliibacter ruber]|uniref:ATP-grasp domain-containing protein n=1 Tax=Mongoliibacter ruber TaxID=1750599 RepID=A0A2T0WJQ7_9BACT|nr:ATP-grasp domain-containing protein [Mongoliibacter ruber]PRY86943.1 ATP-grasp domain-containing protein [Mongoliibacter ruber]
MILLDHPYTSDFLKETILQFQIPVIATPQAQEILGEVNANWLSEKDAADILRNNPETKIYTNSENSIAWIEKHTQGTGLPEKIALFKNKYRFRQLIQEAYPDYFFHKAKLEELSGLDIEGFQFPFIIKPIVGFFSIGVYSVNEPNDWPVVVSKIKAEISRTTELYPKEVVDSTEFILEAYITGEEYAFDCYFDENGKPVLLNVLHHVFKSSEDVSDRLYSSSEEIIKSMEAPIMEFLELIASKVNLKNFPLHIEYRMNEDGKLYPIEVNPMRFGGWCTTADLTWFSYGINSYLSFFNSQKPDWNQVFSARKNKKYSLILLDNQSGIPFEQIAYFDFEQLASDFENPLHIRKVNMEKFGVFGFLFTETSKGNEAELKAILHSNLKEYLKLIPQSLV